MNKILTIAEKESLVLSHHEARDGRIRDRIKAVILYDDGYSLEEIAKILLLSREAIRKHIKDYQQQGKLKTANGGSKAKLNAQQQQELAAHPEAHSYMLVKDICAYVQQQYWVSYTIAGMTKLLYKLNFVYKKPKCVPAKLDAAKQEAFKLQYSLLKGGLAKDEAIYFMDSVHPQYQAKARCGWIRKGQVKTLPTNSGWKRLHIVGAVNIKSLQLVSASKPKINGDYIIEFLRQLEAENRDKRKIYLICDNAAYHKSKLVQGYVKASKIELVYLPPYSPNLNPIERLWKFMHAKTTINRYYQCFSNFTEKINSFLGNIKNYSAELRTLINDNFQSIHFNHFDNSSS